MTKTLLQQLYDGELYPAEKINPSSDNYKELIHSIEREKKYFREVLDSEQLVRFDLLDSMYIDINGMHGYANFECGFQLAIKLMMECLILTDSAKQ